MYAKYFAVTAVMMLTLVVVLFVTVGMAERPREKLVLSVHETVDGTKDLIPGSKWYAAELRNEGDLTAKLQAVQFEGGEYGGSGKFFACSLQGWHREQHQWLRLWTSHAGPAPHFVDVEVKAGDHREVCNMLLPSQAGSVGQCVRFKLLTRWHGPSSYVVFSKPFVIGNLTAKNGLCRE